MRIFILSFLLVIVSLGVEGERVEQEEELYLYDEFGNLVKLEYNESDASIPWDSNLNVEDDVKFYVYPSSNVQNELFVGDIESLANSGIDMTEETVFITHGWRSSKNADACVLIRNGILKQRNANVIVVDWSKISNDFYLNAALKVPSVGKRVAEMISFLKQYGMRLQTTTLVGHSLGAHVMGLAGYYFEKKANMKVNYIVGLDPAGPLFGSKGPGERISVDDAAIVEVIHTNAGRLGFAGNLGKVDFYPNGGRSQPECSLIPPVSHACAHSRAYEYFAESLTSDVGFFGKRCLGFEITPEACKGELGIMGTLRSFTNEEGTYYVPTNGKSPFAQGLPE